MASAQTAKSSRETAKPLTCAFGLKICTAMRRLNTRYDEWQARAAARLIAKLDHPADIGNKPLTKSHIGVWDLLPNKRESGAEKAVK
jgi:hypothetical protein